MEKSAIDWKTVAKLFGGGALLGGGVGAITSYMRHMDALKHELAAQHDTSQDDDTLYVDLKRQPLQKKASDDASGSTFALGSLGALLGAWMAYNGVRRHYNRKRHEDLQGQLDQSQHLYVDALRNSVAPKQASFPALSVGSGTVGLATLLTMLGTAAVANRALNKQFPALKSPDRDKPKRIVIQDAQEAPEVEEHPEEPPVQEVSPEAREAMLRAVVQTPKTASAFNWDDVVSAVAQGRGPEIFDLCSNGLGDSVFDVCRGASQIKSSSLNRNLAVTWLASEPLVATTLEPAMAAAVSELGTPDLIKFASTLSPKAQAHAICLAELSAVAVRKQAMASLCLPDVKEAFGPDELLAARAVQSLLSNNQESDQDDLEPLRKKPSSQGKSKESNEPSTEEPHPLMEVHGDEAKKFLAKFGPELQAAL